MISTNEFRTGVTIEVDGEVYAVIDFQHVKPGKGSAFVRSKLRNVRTGAVIEKTFRAGERFPHARIDRREMQYLYRDGDNFVFMDTQTFDQFSMPEERLGDATKYMKEGIVITVLLYGGAALGVELPNFVDLEVVEAAPGFKGDTATGGTKRAKLETGAVVHVPFFVEVGQTVRIDTRTGQYLERV